MPKWNLIWKIFLNFVLHFSKISYNKDYRNISIFKTPEHQNEGFMASLSIKINNAVFPVIELPRRPRVLLDRTVAEIYDVETKQVNRAVSRNSKRFPEDFCFQLTKEEAKSLKEITQGQLSWSKGYLPKAFTHLGCNMLATVMESDIAIERSIQIIRAFSQLEVKTTDSTKPLSNSLVEILRELKESHEETKATSGQILSLTQEFSKMSERMNVLETRIEAVMKARGNFNENHWLFGKFTEIIAEGIDQNRNEISEVNEKLNKLTHQINSVLYKKTDKKKKL